MDCDCDCDADSRVGVVSSSEDGVDADDADDDDVDDDDGEALANEGRLGVGTRWSPANPMEDAGDSDDEACCCCCCCCCCCSCCCCLRVERRLPVGRANGLATVPPPLASMSSDDKDDGDCD